MNVKATDTLSYNTYIDSLIKTKKLKLSESSEKNQEKKSRRIQQILNKFRSGAKLTAEELQFLAVNAPTEYEKVKRIIAEREQLENKLKEAKTKEEVQTSSITSLTIPGTISSSANTSGADVAIARHNQLNGAIRAYRRTMDYQNKPEDNQEIYGKDEEEKKV